MVHALDLEVLAGDFAVARLGPSAPVPAWAHDAALSSVTRTAAELSIVCPAAAVPGDVRREEPFRALAVRGPLDFALTGILDALTRPLARAGISIFALSTFDTDTLLVRAGDLAAAVAALEAAGHRIAG